MIIKKHKTERILLATMVILIITIVVIYTNNSRKRIAMYAKESVVQSTSKISKQISNYIKDSKNSIKLISEIIEISSTENKVDKLELLERLKPTTSFNYVEYINKNGMNIINTEKTFDASDRIYYKSGITGKSGIWINYEPKYSDEYLINFYTPLKIEEKIDGIITGAFESNKIFLPLIEASLFGREMISVLCDEKNQVICSTFKFEKDKTLFEYLKKIGIDEKWVKEFYNRIETNDNSFFRFDGRKGFSNACVYRIEETNWSIIQIIPSKDYREIIYKSVYEEIITISIIILLFLFYLIKIRFKFKTDLRILEEQGAIIEAKSLQDALTGFFNRRAYDNAIELLEEEVSTENITIIEFDVNSLKKVNDTIGHEAGDELIKGAAYCIKSIFGELGTCYRTGGDEFTVIIQRQTEKSDVLLKRFKECQKNWIGNLVTSISISVGVADSKTYPTFPVRRLIHIADEKMYENKRKHYEKLSNEL